MISSIKSGADFFAEAEICFRHFGIEVANLFSADSDDELSAGSAVEVFSLPEIGPSELRTRSAEWAFLYFHLTHECTAL